MKIKSFPTGLCCVILGFLNASMACAESKPKPPSLAKAVFNQDFLTQTSAKKDKQQKAVAVFIELKKPSLAAFVVHYTNTHGKPPTPAKQKRYSTTLEAEQKDFMRYLSGLNAKHLSNLRVSANGVKCRVMPSEIATIKAHALVKSVSLIQARKKNSASHNPAMLNANGVLSESPLSHLGLSGKGKTIAIVGTGINYQLEAFGGDYTFDDSDKIINDPNIIELGTFPTAKVIAGIDLAGADYDSDDENNNRPLEDADPYEPFFSHETLVAAIAAGIAVEDRVSAGVAPDAKLIAIKIFGDNKDNTELVADGIEYALDPNRDGSMDDKADVINLSVQTAFGRSNDVDSLAASNAVAMGVVVVASAGNTGNRPFITASPAVADTAIAVGSHASATLREDDNPFTPSQRIFHIQSELDGQAVFYPARALSRFTSRLEAFNANVVIANPIDTCEPLKQDVKGKVVVFRFTDCPGFANDQEDLAEDAGAAASIQIENNNNTLGISFAGIPAYRMYQTQGEELLQALVNNPDLTLTFDNANTQLNTAQDFKVSGFSARGPSFGAGEFKPDLIAPGQNIVAGGAPFADSGTSFSAPYVAGLAAVLLQHNPSFSPADVKATLQNSTTPSRTLNHASAPFYPLSRQGVGRVQADKSLQLTSLASPGGLSFGVLNPAQKHFETRTLTLKNFTNQRRHFKVTVEPGQANPGVALRVPREIHMPPHSVKTLPIRLVADPRKLTIDTHQNTLIEADGWIVLTDEVDILRVGYAAAVEPASQIDIAQNQPDTLTLSNTGLVGSTIEAFSQVQFIDDEDVVDDARAFYPSNAGYRVKPLEDGNTEINMVFTFDAPLQTLMDKRRAIDVYLPNEEGDYQRLSLAIVPPLFIREAEPFIHQAEVDVVEDEYNLFLDAKVAFDFNQRWFTVRLVTAGNASAVISENPSFAFYFEANSGLFRTGFDVQDQAELNTPSAFIAPQSEITIKQLRQSQSEGGFIVVNKNRNASAIIDF